MLLYPERGLVLNATAADVVKLCTGEHTVAAIVERLAEKYAPQPARGRSSGRCWPSSTRWPSAGSSGASG